MSVIISCSTHEQQFGQNKIITIGSSELNDFSINNQNFELTLEFDEQNNIYILTNDASSDITFKGEKFTKLEIKNIARLMFSNSNEYINIKVLPKNENIDNNIVSNTSKKATSTLKLSELDKAKEEIEEQRIIIIKQISHKVSAIKKKLSQNLKGIILAHIALFFSCLVCAFGVTNYISGLSIQESVNYIHLPSDLKLWFIYTVLILGVMLLFKQGMFGYFYSKTAGNQPKMNNTTQSFLIFSSLFIMTGVYIINLIYYLDYTKKLAFPILISLFFVGIAICLGISSAFYKSNRYELSELLNKYEYREDFEKVLKDYQTWIGYYVNGLSEGKLQYINDTMFKLHIKEFFETLTGIITAPFLAFGVSNTLALCFPDAAGWIRISGSSFRFSPIFLILATFMILFAFFLFVHGFEISRKISNSDVIKQDGFSNYLVHCAEIYGLEGTSRAKKEMSFTFYVAAAIILIEFTMNVSYFTNEIGQDFYGLILSIIAALVPTSLLLAETFLLGNTKFRLYALEEIMAKADK